MKKLTLLTAFLMIAFFIKAQDLIIKTDGTTLKGQVISFQNNKLTVLQEDESEITLNKKAVSTIKFNYIEKDSVALKTETAKLEEKLTATTTPSVKVIDEPKKVETPKPISSPAPAVTAKSVAIESVGEVMGLDKRTLIASPKLKETPIGAGRVVVNICLNAEGQVINAKFKPVGSTTLNADLISLAVQNAKEFKFSKGSPDECGTVVYRFNLD